MVKYEVGTADGLALNATFVIKRAEESEGVEVHWDEDDTDLTGLNQNKWKLRKLNSVKY